MMAWSPGHLAILKLLLAHLLHIVITAICVGVVKIDRITCRGQYLKSYLLKIFQTDRIHKYIYGCTGVSRVMCLTRSHTDICLIHAICPNN